MMLLFLGHYQQGTVSLKMGWQLLLRRRGRRTCGAQNALDRRRFEQSLEHTARSSVLQTLVGGEGVLRPITSVTEFADVQCIRLLVLILEMPLEGIVTAEGASTVRTLLRFVDSSRSGWRHPHRPSCNTRWC